MDTGLVVIFACLTLMAITTVAIMIIIVARGKSSIRLEWSNNKVIGSVKLKAEGNPSPSDRNKPEVHEA